MNKKNKIVISNYITQIYPHNNLAIVNADHDIDKLLRYIHIMKICSASTLSKTTSLLELSINFDKCDLATATIESGIAQ